MTKVEIKKYVYDIAKVLSDKKAQEIIVIDFDDKNDITDYMIICHAESITHLRALANYVEEMVQKKYKTKTINRRTFNEKNPWILLDFVFVIVHIFEKETRNFYNIEKLWMDAKSMKFEIDEKIDKII